MPALIGWVFLYAVLVIFSFYVYELMSALRHWRSSDLYNVILHMLGDPELTDRVWTHPLIRALTPPSQTGPYRGPTEIPPELFAVALFDALPPAPSAAAGGVAERIAAVSNPATRDVLRLFLERSEGSVRLAETAVADWFEQTTRALSTWQLRRLFRFISTLIIAATILLAADALALWLGLAGPVADTPLLIGTAFQQSVSLLVTAVAAIGAPLWGSLANQVLNLLLRRRSPPPPLQRLSLEGRLTLDHVESRQEDRELGR
jgi:hypothetical protein